MSTEMKIRSINEAELALRPYVPLVSQLTGRDTTLARIRPLMQFLGNPQERLKVLHIAGTSGKTSTAYYTAGLIYVTGKTVGLTVSPHVDSIKERVQINGRQLSDDEFCYELTVFLENVQASKITPSYFELLYAFALWEFDRKAVDYAVVETGMGGIFDATNIAERADKLCIITDIGFDHMHILGHTLPEIAAQKIGIVHPGNTVFMYRQSDEVMAVVQRWVTDHDATLHLIGSKSDELTTEITNPKMPDYQRRNWLLAHFAYNFIANRDNLPRMTSEALAKTQMLQVPGRMDVSYIGGKTVIMDGAHNAQKMTSFIESFSKLYPDEKPVVLLALKQGKEYKDVVPQLAKIAGRVILTTFATSQDLPVRSLTPETLEILFKKVRPELRVAVLPDLAQAYRAFLASSETHGIITGSFYLLSQIRKMSA